MTGWLISVPVQEFNVSGSLVTKSLGSKTHSLNTFFLGFFFSLLRFVVLVTTRNLEFARQCPPEGKAVRFPEREAQKKSVDCLGRRRRSRRDDVKLNYLNHNQRADTNRITALNLEPFCRVPCGHTNHARGDVGGWPPNKSFYSTGHTTHVAGDSPAEQP